MKRFVAVVVVVFVIFWISKQPASAAVAGKGLMSGLGSLASGMIDFIGRVTS
jgi:hypothetical protein